MAASQAEPVVISASRRTDIPAHWLDWFLGCLGRGGLTLTNPYNGSSREVSLRREDVHSLVFWSKNYGPLLERLPELEPWPLAFNFTLNSPDPLLEPSLPPLEDRLEQMAALVRVFGPRAVRWRHDPVAFYELEGRARDNLGEFERLLDRAAALGLDCCTVSFMDHYRKIDLRQARVPGLRFVYPEKSRLLEVAAWMSEHASRRGVRLLTCCEAVLAGSGIANLAPGGCIDHARLEGLHGGRLSHRVDRGQRRDSGCLCHESVDIGSYRGQPCRCGCLYCYANPLVA
ncbi:DUF1848 domain-containing protein [bacterium]|nr:DUF1848 domain-containing protein [bacterium]